MINRECNRPDAQIIGPVMTGAAGNTISLMIKYCNFQLAAN